MHPDDPLPTTKIPVPGDRVAHYRMLEPLGAGGMGQVYRARDEQLQRDVAIKLLSPSAFGDPVARARLVQEARAAAALNHPHVCTIHQVGEANGQPYIAMELVDGQTLASLIAGGPLPVDQVVRYARQLADGLAHAHARGVVHRDLKSANVIVSLEGRLKILDFGLAKRTSAATDVTASVAGAQPLTELGTAMGTLVYMAPEQLRGQVAQTQSDVWALGIVLHEMIAGRRPFTGTTEYEVCAAILQGGPIDLPPHTPPPLAAIIGRCLERDPALRYPDARSLHAALETMAIPSGTAPLTAPAPQTHTVREMRARVSRRGLLRALGAAIALVVLIALGMTAWQQFLRTEPRSLAVLPFRNPAGDEQLEYLCDGIAEALIKQTSTQRSIKVRPLRAAFAFKGASVDLGDAGRQLGVESIVSGTMQRRGAGLVITAELIDVASGRQLWTKTYESDSTDLLKIQDQIAGAIVDEGLRMRLTENERSRLVRQPTRDAEAYDLYLQARHLQRAATEEDYLHSRELLKRATIRDPEFALAYGALGGNYAMMAADGHERPNDAWPQAIRNMRKALEFEPDLTEARAVAHAVAFLWEWNWEAAARERQALTSNPAGDFDPHFMRALALERWALGRVDEALSLARRTRELDPLSAYLAMLEADYLVHAGQYDAAIAVYERAIRQEPLSPNPHFGLAEALFRQGRFDDAIEARRRAHATVGDDSLKVVFESARGEQGYRLIDRASVRAQLEELQQREKTSYVSPLDYARAHAQLGDTDLAFKYLDAAFADRSPGLVFLNVDRAWDTIRGDQRFAAAVRRVGLPEPDAAVRR